MSNEIERQTLDRLSHGKGINVCHGVPEGRWRRTNRSPGSWLRSQAGARDGEAEASSRDAESCCGSPSARRALSGPG